MIHTLRKRHRMIWLVLAIALPVLYLLAISVIPEKVTQEKLYQQPAQSKNIEVNQ